MEPPNRRRRRSACAAHRRHAADGKTAAPAARVAVPAVFASCSGVPYVVLNGDAIGPNGATDEAGERNRDGIRPEVPDQRTEEPREAP